MIAAELGISQDALEKLKEFTTPCYVFDREKFSDNVAVIRRAFEKACGSVPILGYSVKTNNSEMCLRAAKANGMMAEVVSETEYALALRCGFDGSNIIANGPEKTISMLKSCIENGSVLNFDNLREIEQFKRIVAGYGKERAASLRLGIRVNYEVERYCREDLKTDCSRFGICVENGDFEHAISTLRSMGVHRFGLHYNISSKTRSDRVYASIAEETKQLVKRYQLYESVLFVDVGGGFFGGQLLPGKPSMDNYAEAIVPALSEVLDLSKVPIILEPGSSVISTAVHYLTEVLNIRDIRGTTIVTVDGSDLDINPFMTEREPMRVDLNRSTSRQTKALQLVCGSTCMETDLLFAEKNASTYLCGDRILCLNVGSYTASFNNQFINQPPAHYEV